MPSLAGTKLDALYCMFKGEPGTRKSTCALSFPKPQYWFDTDGKIESLILPARNWGINFSDIEYDNHDDWNSVLRKLEQLELNCKYKTVIIDSITSMGDTINSQTRRLKMGTTTVEGGEKGKRIGGISVNSMEDYNAEASAFNQIVALTKSIKQKHNANVILIAHVIGDRAQSATTLTHFSRIIVTGGKTISAKLSAYALEAYHFNIEEAANTAKEGKYGLYTVHTGLDFARTALPLDMYINFGNEPLYDKFILPAIKKLQPSPSTASSLGVK